VLTESALAQVNEVLKVIPEHNLILIKGSVAGCKGSIVLVKE